eukprot:CAMPEP_0179847996 /NCGR_PEP_ID=MMETSP0982-20121206/6386_1 /TAXON_ID=483367 /ORGANISM="non described non described, Strain CCMP 2436" /LENGTH=54 /DNA_ID=CAMNT_0021733229 /DNA_START=481 /DNA_END=645 /DNA_ORIENTATION=-
MGENQLSKGARTNDASLRVQQRCRDSYYTVADCAVLRSAEQRTHVLNGFEPVLK